MIIKKKYPQKKSSSVQMSFYYNSRLCAKVQKSSLLNHCCQIFVLTTQINQQSLVLNKQQKPGRSLYQTFPENDASFFRVIQAKYHELFSRKNYEKKLKGYPLLKYNHNQLQFLCCEKSKFFQFQHQNVLFLELTSSPISKQVSVVLIQIK